MDETNPFEGLSRLELANKRNELIKEKVRNDESLMEWVSGATDEEMAEFKDRAYKSFNETYADHYRPQYTVKDERANVGPMQHQQFGRKEKEKVPVPIMDPESEALLAVVNDPEFDPSVLSSVELTSLVNGLPVAETNPRLIDRIKDVARDRVGVNKAQAAAMGLFRGAVPFAGAAMDLTPEEKASLRLSKYKYDAMENTGAVTGLLGTGVGVAMKLPSLFANTGPKTAMGLSLLAEGGIGVAYADVAPGIIAELRGKPNDYLLNFVEAASIAGAAGGGFAMAKKLIGKPAPVGTDTLKKALSDKDTTFKPIEAEGSKLGDEIFNLGIAEGGSKTRKAADEFLAWIQPKGHLPEDAFRAKEKMRGNVNAWMKRMENRHKALRKGMDKHLGKGWRNSPDTIQRMNSALQGRMPDGQWVGVEKATEGLPKDIRDPLITMRRDVDDLSRQIRDSGAVPEKMAPIFDGNMEQYLHRSYRMFDDPKWKQKVDDETYNKAYQYVEGQLKQRKRDASPQAVTKVLVDILDQGDGKAISKMSSAVRKNTGILKKKDEIAPEIRALMGEYTDPLSNYAKSVSRMANLLETQRFMEEVREIGTGKFLFKDPPNSNYVPIKADSPLKDLYTTPEIRTALSGGDEIMPINEAWLKSWMTANSYVSLGKTVLSPQTHMRNLQGGVIMTMANGHLPIGRGWDRFRRSWGTVGKDLRKDFDSELEELARLGVINESAKAGVLRDMLDDAAGKTSMDDVVSGLVRHDTESAIQVGKKMAGRAIRKSVDVYQGEDDLMRVFGYYSELDRIKSALPGLDDVAAKEYASRTVRDTYPTYSKVGKAFKLSRRFPVLGNFVSFPAEIFRTTGNILDQAQWEMYGPELSWNKSARYGLEWTPDLKKVGAKRMAGIISTLSAFPSTAKAAQLAFGITPEEDQAAKEFMPPWTKNSSVWYLGRPKDGKVSYVDMSYTNPYSYLEKPVIAALQGENVGDKMWDSFVQFISPFAEETIFTRAVLDIRANKDENGNEIYNPADSFEKKMGAAMTHFWEGTRPGVFNSADRIWKAATTDELTLGTELTAQVIGVRKSEFTVEKGMSFKIRDFSDKTRNTSKMFNALPFSPDNKGTQQILSGYENALQREYESWKDFYKTAKAANDLGYGFDKIFGQMKNRRTGLSHDDLKGLLNGYYVPHEISDDMIQVGRDRTGVELPRLEMSALRQKYYGMALTD